MMSKNREDPYPIVVLDKYGWGYSFYCNTELHCTVRNIQNLLDLFC